MRQRLQQKQAGKRPGKFLRLIEGILIGIWHLVMIVVAVCALICIVYVLLITLGVGGYMIGVGIRHFLHWVFSFPWPFPLGILLGMILIPIVIYRKWKGYW
jgi:hypothetical protein